MTVDVTVAAVGRWPSILTHYGLDSKSLSGKHGPCPVCGGDDRFRFDDKERRGTFYCSQCGAGDGFKLLMLLKGWDFKSAAREVGEIVGVMPSVKSKPVRTPEENRRALRNFCEQTLPLTPNDAVAQYLRNRRAWHDDIRDVKIIPRMKVGGQEVACMAAAVRDDDGSVVQLQRTYIAGGKKADLKVNPALMQGELPPGRMVRLFDVGEHLGIAEGIETAVSCMNLFGVPTWASMTAGNMRKFKAVPFGVRRVTIFADNDRGYTGQAAAFWLANRLSYRGKDLPQLSVEVRIPEHAGTDWNDVIKASAADPHTVNYYQEAV